MIKLKHLLPPFKLLDNIHLSSGLIKDLQNLVTNLDDQFKPLIDVNKTASQIHRNLVEDSYENFYEIALTDSAVTNTSIDFNSLKVLDQNLDLGSKAKSFRNKKELMFNENSLLNESLHNIRTKYYEQYQELIDKVVDQFKSKPSRIRLGKVFAGKHISPHIDYDPSYKVRIIIPIISDKDCINTFWVKNEIISTTFNEGNAYFLNTGYRHAVMNFSKNDRYTLMISLDNQQDIAHLL
jgi:hypothetical protein